MSSSSLVLMDIMMPEMDGYETIEAIRKAARWTDLPIVALTAKATPGDREKFIAQGANEYVPKPVDVDRLLSVVSSALLRQKFAVVLLDVRMPGMDGFETASNIKRLDQTKNVPIIFLTGTGTGTGTGTDGDSGYAFRGYATGAAEFLTTPFDPWVLRAKVNVFLELHRKNRQLERMLAQERQQFVLLARQLAEIEEVVKDDCRGDASELRDQVSRMRETLTDMRRGQGS